MRKCLRITCLALALLPNVAAGAEPARQPEAASGFAPKPTATGKRFMAVTANFHATDAATEILAAGGSAIDAAIAAQLVLNLVEPQSSGIGGGGFLLYHDADKGTLRAYDGRETAPAAASADRFLGPEGKPLAFHEAAVGGRSVGVPGLLALIELAYRNHGRLPWPHLFAPALRLAVEGFSLSPRLHKLLEEDRFLRSDPQARALYYQEDGHAKQVGTRIVNREFAATLLLLAQQSSWVLYQGAIGRDIVAAVRGHARQPGDLAEGDLAGYRAVERAPLCGTRLDRRRVCGMPPPSSGGLAVLQILELVERGGIAAEAPLAPRSVHWFSEAGRLAYADRSRYLADPIFVPVPVQGLLDSSYLARRASLIREERSMGRAEAGELPVVQSHGQDDAAELPATTHLSIVDAQGNAAALTSSIEDAFGSRIMVRGFLLNNQLTDFSFRSEERGRPIANRVEPGKRPLSSMSPTIVYDRDGGVAAVLGSPGGSRIINYIAGTLFALFSWNLPVSDAVALPHYGSRNGPTELERGTAAEALRFALEKLGHDVVFDDMTSGLHVIVRKGEEWIGVADPRREGTARGGGP